MWYVCISLSLSLILRYCNNDPKNAIGRAFFRCNNDCNYGVCNCSYVSVKTFIYVECKLVYMAQVHTFPKRVLAAGRITIPEDIRILLDAHRGKQLYFAVSEKPFSVTTQE